MLCDTQSHLTLCCSLAAFRYVHFPAASAPDTAYWDGNDYILLARVPPHAILNRSAYEFYCAVDCAANAHMEVIGGRRTGGAAGQGGWAVPRIVWLADDARATPVFSHRHMTGQDHTVYVPALRRYILPNYGFLDPRSGLPGGWHQIYDGGITPVGQLALLESAHPWGPWALFHLEQPWNWEGGHAAYSPDLPQKWASADGRTLAMVSSACCGAPGYTYHVTTLQLTLNGSSSGGGCEHPWSLRK